MTNSRVWRDLIAIVSLVVLLLLAFPLLGSLFEDAVELRVLPTPLPARIFLLPLRQVFAVGETQPITPTRFLVYEGGTDVFQMIERRDSFVRLQTLDANFNFWTQSENVSLLPPLATQADFSARGTSARINGANGFACLQNVNASPPFATCQKPANLTRATLIARIVSDAVEFYLGEVEGVNYFIAPEAIIEVK
ncbi:MAG: hypothetical protein HZC40_09245 [Chloroflexi bacterium]|nr:hypothetical protein [Chloroflexota bacterium]